MKLALTILGRTYALAYTCDPDDTDEAEAEAATTTTSSIEFGFAPYPEPLTGPYWEDK